MERGTEARKTRGGDKHVEMIQREQEVCTSHQLTSSSVRDPAQLLTIPHTLFSIRLRLSRCVRCPFLNQVRRIVGQRIGVRWGFDGSCFGELAEEEPSSVQRRRRVRGVSGYDTGSKRKGRDRRIPAAG
jgi:hypothetical protein